MILLNPLVDKTGFIQVLEIFDLKGFTPTNQHRAADEVFVVLHGQGEATLGDARLQLKPGSVLLHPGFSHAVRNTGSTRLYCLTTMVPDKDLARLITSGLQNALDAEDRAILAWKFFIIVLKLQLKTFSCDALSRAAAQQKSHSVKTERHVWPAPADKLGQCLA